MIKKVRKWSMGLLSFTLLSTAAAAVTFDHLPPLPNWQGKSESLINHNTRQKTPAELTDLVATPNYRETVAYIHKLAASSPYLRLTMIGKTAQGKALFMVVASRDGMKDAKGIRANKKPTILLQAGIHSGEIDGKDAGLMLLRDISLGKEVALIQQVNLLFIPILSADGHERASAYNRVNQRGPEKMGWRTNSRNLNLNRDYAKLDTEELHAVTKVINDYQPDLYLDIHVTDGEDYQYDITYGFNQAFASDSPNIARWMQNAMSPYVDKQLTDWGHIPGPLTFAMDKRNFAKGLAGWNASARFSNGYGDLRQLPTVLVENHSLKPYKQRVLGTYVFVKAVMEYVGKDHQALKTAIATDRQARPKKQVIAYSYDKKPEHIAFKGVEYENYVDEITGINEVRWTGKPKNYEKLPVFWQRVPAVTVDVPKAYIVPPQYKAVIASLKAHGIVMTQINEDKEKQEFTVEQLKAVDHKFDKAPFEGRLRVSAKFERNILTTTVPRGSVMISTDQPLGRLAVALLEPEGPDSYFAWGFFNTIFQRTEYIENYAIIPLAKKMMAEQPRLKQMFEQKLKDDPEFAKDPRARLDFFYTQTQFYDQAYLQYPVLTIR